jgi:fumarate hydratase, class II
VIKAKVAGWMHIVKIGRIHLEDTTPLTVGREWSFYVAQIRGCMDAIAESRRGLYELAVGTVLNAIKGISFKVADEIANLTGKPFVIAANKFMAEGSRHHGAGARGIGRGRSRADEGPERHALARLRTARGLGKLKLPQNEPGSSITPND